jgi:hypothetical protein
LRSLPWFGLGEVDPYSGRTCNEAEDKPVRYAVILLRLVLMLTIASAEYVEKLGLANCNIQDGSRCLKAKIEIY